MAVAGYGCAATARAESKPEAQTAKGHLQGRPSGAAAQAKAV